MKLWPVAHFFHSLLESGNIQNIAACHFLYCCKEMTCCNVLYVARFQKWVKKVGNWLEFHSERIYCLQNWYFSTSHLEKKSIKVWLRLFWSLEYSLKLPSLGEIFELPFGWFGVLLLLELFGLKLDVEAVIWIGSGISGMPDLCWSTKALRISGLSGKREENISCTY